MAVKRTAKKAAAKKSVKKAAPRKSAMKKGAVKKGAVKKKAAKGRAKKAKSGAAADRARVSKQAHEVAYVAKKFGVDAKAVTKAITKVGNMREAVYAELKASKARSRAADRALVSRQPHEIAHLAQKFNVTEETVLAAVEQHGRSRKKVEAALTQ